MLAYLIDKKRNIMEKSLREYVPEIHIAKEEPINPYAPPDDVMPNTQIDSTIYKPVFISKDKEHVIYFEGSIDDFIREFLILYNSKFIGMGKLDDSIIRPVPQVEKKKSEFASVIIGAISSYDKSPEKSYKLTEAIADVASEVIIKICKDFNANLKEFTK